MKLLAIDTATENCSVGLSVPDQEVALLEAITPAGHSKLVHGMIRQLLDRYNIEYADLDGIVVDTGPGSFTGVRIGIGVAQGLAYAADLPVLGISSLQALATETAGDYCLAAIDARMQQVYWALYKYDKDAPTLSCGPLVTAPESVDELVAAQLHQGSRRGRDRGRFVGTGSGWDSYPAELQNAKDRFGIATMQNRFPGAQGLLSVARQKLDAEGLGCFGAATVLTATYVRDEIAAKMVVR